MKNSASSPGRWLDVAPARFPGWIAGFAERHGEAAAGLSLRVVLAGESVIFTAPDGAVAECHAPFPPVAGLDADAGPAAWAEAVAAHALAPRSVGVLLVRLGGYAVGVFTGSPPRLAVSKTGSRPVHGRSAAGGWSQHRFARRREKQANEALQAAADAAAGVFGRWAESHGTNEAAPDNSKMRQPDVHPNVHPDNSKMRQPDVHPNVHPDNSKMRQPDAHPDNSKLRPPDVQRQSDARRDNSKMRQPRVQPPDNSKMAGGGGRDRSGKIEGASAGPTGSGHGTGLDAVVLGGDKRAVAELRGDPRLLCYLELATDRFLTVPDPKLAVLKDAPRLFLAVRISLREPAA